jgi:hypothetical protein
MSDLDRPQRMAPPIETERGGTARRLRAGGTRLRDGSSDHPDHEPCPRCTPYPYGPPAISRHATCVVRPQPARLRAMRVAAWRSGYGLADSRAFAWYRVSAELNVVCDLPTDDGPRERDSCHVFPRVALPYEVALRRAAPDVAAGTGAGATRAGEAARALESAITLRELSLLVGSAPGECLRKSRTHQLCRWQSSNQTPGHALIAAVIDEDRRVVLACRLPYDDAPRDQDSCEVSLKR